MAHCVISLFQREYISWHTGQWSVLVNYEKVRALSQDEVLYKRLMDINEEAIRP